jgi:hypothetical protein
MTGRSVFFTARKINRPAAAGQAHEEHDFISNFGKALA